MLTSVTQSLGLVAKVKSAGQNKTDTTLADVTDLSIAIGAGESWVVTWNLAVVLDLTGLLKVAVTTPAAASQRIQAAMLNGALSITGTTTTSGTAINLNPAAAVTDGNVTVVASVVNSTTAGNITLQFAQFAANGTTTVSQFSSAVARRV